MRLRRLRGNGWAARLAILALILNALVPVHLAFDLAEALAPAPAQPAAAESGGLEWRLLSTLSGHSGRSGDHGRQHRPECPVCGALASLAGAVPSAAPALPVPPQVATARVAALPGWPREAAPAAAYRSRAPPIA